MRIEINLSTTGTYPLYNVMYLYLRQFSTTLYITITVEACTDDKAWLASKYHQSIH